MNGTNAAPRRFRVRNGAAEQAQEREMIDSASVFNSLYESKNVILKGYIRNLTSHEADAEDILQNTLIKINKAIRKGRRAGLENLLFRIAYNETVNHRRKEKTADTTLLNLIEGIDSEASGDIADVVISTMLLQKIFLALDLLENRKHRLVCRLYFLEGTPVAEIVADTGIPKATVYRYLNSGLDRVRECLGVPTCGGIESVDLEIFKYGRRMDADRVPETAHCDPRTPLPAQPSA